MRRSGLIVVWLGASVIACAGQRPPANAAREPTVAASAPSSPAPAAPATAAEGRAMPEDSPAAAQTGASSDRAPLDSLRKRIRAYYNYSLRPAGDRAPAQLEIKVGPNGEIIAVRPDPHDASSDAVARCIERTLANAKLDAPAGTTTLRIPFTIDPQ